ncbi:MAG: hypothetical protein JKY01_11720, partial [Pseudomonadales bacterium]|nr:hypothetical protein [Pseudomonadales bacterium]
MHKTTAVVLLNAHKPSTNFLKLFTLLCFLITTSISHSATPKLSDDDYQTLLEKLKQTPTLFADNEGLIGKLSSKQLDNAITSLGLSHYSFLHPVIIKGSEIPAMIKGNIADYSIMVVRGGRLLPVPFQIDEISKEGFVYLEGEGELDGEHGIIDENDELLFMYRDTSIERYNKDMALDGEIVKELEFNRINEQRFAYLIKNSKSRSSSRYVSYDPVTSTAKNTFYGFKTQPDNFLMFEDFYANVGDEQGHRVLDSVFAVIETRVLSKYSPKIHLNTFEDIKAVPLGTIDGPVRNAVIISLNVVVANITVFKIRAQMDIFDQMLGFNAKITIPG